MRGPLIVLATLAALPLFGEVKEFHKTLPLATSGAVSLSSHNGSVSVVAWNQPSVSIDARIEEPEFEGRAEDVRNTDVKVTSSGSAVNIETDYSRVETHYWLFGLGQTRSLPPVHYVIHMPADARLRIEVHNAKVKAAGLAGAVNVETHNGDVALTALSGGASVETHNGDVDLDFARVAAASRIQTHNGEARVSVPADARISLSADGHRRNPVSSELPVAVRTSSGSWNASLNGGGTELRFTTHNGTLRLRRR